MMKWSDEKGVIYCCNNCDQLVRLHSGTPYCKKTEREIKHTHEVPEWCPLEDFKEGE